MLENEKWLLKKLWVDKLENSTSEAMGYELYGFVDTEDVANKIIELAGFYEGDGWPVAKGSKIPKIKAYRIERIVMPIET